MRRKLKRKPSTSDFCFWGVVSDTTPHVIPNDVTPQQPLSCHTRHPIQGVARKAHGRLMYDIAREFTQRQHGWRHHGLMTNVVSFSNRFAV